MVLFLLLSQTSPLHFIACTLRKIPSYNCLDTKSEAAIAYHTSTMHHNAKISPKHLFKPMELFIVSNSVLHVYSASEQTMSTFPLFTYCAEVCQVAQSSERYKDRPTRLSIPWDYKSGHPQDDRHTAVCSASAQANSTGESSLAAGK